MYFAAAAQPRRSGIESLHPAAWTAPVSLLTDAELSTRAYLGSVAAEARRAERRQRADRSAGPGSRTRRLFTTLSFGATR